MDNARRHDAVREFQGRGKGSAGPKANGDAVTPQPVERSASVGRVVDRTGRRIGNSFG